MRLDGDDHDDNVPLLCLCSFSGTVHTHTQAITVYL